MVLLALHSVTFDFLMVVTFKAGRHHGWRLSSEQ